MNQLDQGRPQDLDFIHGGKHKVIKLLDNRGEILHDHLRILLTQICKDFILSKTCQQLLV